MAGKKQKLEETAEVPAVEGPQAAAETALAGPPLTDYCILVNSTKMSLSCPLRSGRHVNLGPRVTGMDINRSGPILKTERTDILFQWEKKGWLTFEPA